MKSTPPSEFERALEALDACIADEEDGSGYLWDLMLTDNAVFRRALKIADRLEKGWFLVPPEPTDEMIRAYMFERAKGQYPHEDAGGCVARKIKAFLTGKRQSGCERTYHQIIDAAMKEIDHDR